MAAPVKATEQATTYPTVLPALKTRRPTSELGIFPPAVSATAAAIPAAAAAPQTGRGGCIKWHEHPDLIHIALRTLDTMGNKQSDITACVKRL
jgi:hypothetical protein